MPVPAVCNMTRNRTSVGAWQHEVHPSHLCNADMKLITCCRPNAAEGKEPWTPPEVAAVLEAIGRDGKVHDTDFCLACVLHA